MAETITEQDKPNIFFNLLKVIPIIILIATVGGGWAVNAWKNERQDKELEDLQKDKNVLLDRTARMDERQKSIQSDIKHIKYIIDRLK